MIGFGYAHEEGRCLRVTWRGVELMRYVYAPWDAQVESPRPYFHPLRTIAGDLVSLYRPHDHVWHKGIALSLSNVGDENFWGGPTYLRERGYEQLPNNGSMRHDRFERLDTCDGVLRVDERLTWDSQAGSTLFSERREFAVTMLSDAAAWQLAFRTTVRNTGAEAVVIGSPTTQGRENAGYSGLFWRGPRTFAGGRVVMPGVTGGDELMGRRAAWLAFVGRHDGHGRDSTVLFRDDPDNLQHPVQWFVRAEPYACVCPSPFFSAECPLAPGCALTLRYDVVIADGALEAAAAERLAARAGTLTVDAS